MGNDSDGVFTDAHLICKNRIRHAASVKITSKFSPGDPWHVSLSCVMPLLFVANTYKFTQQGFAQFPEIGISELCSSTVEYVRIPGTKTSRGTPGIRQFVGATLLNCEEQISSDMALFVYRPFFGSK